MKHSITILQLILLRQIWVHFSIHPVPCGHDNKYHISLPPPPIDGVAYADKYVYSQVEYRTRQSIEGGNMSKVAKIICPGIDEYMDQFMRFFHRPEGHALAESYVCGLLIDGERKSVEPMSERVNASERSMQRLLSQVKLDEQGILSTYQEKMLAVTSDPMGLFLIDDTSFPKKGRESACVSRQYCGAIGKIDNCQVGVSMTYIGQGVAWPFGMKLFVPESWNSADAECMRRRAKTKMPDSAHYRPKWRIALELLDEAISRQVPHWAVIADSWYGNIPEFRQELIRRGELYILGVC